MTSRSPYNDHSRRFREKQYVYPVVSRRSGGLSVGINLSPTARCNFACVYCQVLGDPEERLQQGNRFGASMSPLIDMDCLESELREVVRLIVDGNLFDDERFARTPPDKRILRDIAFSGNGEPTLSRQFPEAVRRAAAVRGELCPESTKLVLITNGTTLNVPTVQAALSNLVANNGEIWAKLDAGSPEFFREVSRSSIPIEKILENLLEASKRYPIVIQTCFLEMHGREPDPEEIDRYIERLSMLRDGGGRILRVQIYTVARNTPEPWAQPLSNGRLQAIVEKVAEATGFQVAPFFSS